MSLPVYLSDAGSVWPVDSNVKGSKHGSMNSIVPVRVTDVADVYVLGG